MITPQQRDDQLADIAGIVDAVEMELKLRLIAKTVVATVKGSPLSLVGVDVTEDDADELADDLEVFALWLRAGAARMGGLP